MLCHNPKNKEKNILNSQNINPIIEDREENYKKKNNFDIYYPLNYQNKNSDDENKKINITNNNKKYQNKSLDTSKTFLSTNKYWERRNKENEIKMEKIRKEEEYKKLKELQNKPNISFKSKKIIENIKNYSPGKKEEKKEKNINNYSYFNLKNNNKINKIKKKNNNNNKIKSKEKSEKTLFQKYKLNVADYMNMKKICSIRIEDIKNKNLTKILNEEKKNNIKYKSCSNLCDVDNCYNEDQIKDNYNINNYLSKNNYNYKNNVINNKKVKSQIKFDLNKKEENNLDLIRKKLNESYNIKGRIINHTYYSDNEEEENLNKIRHNNNNIISNNNFNNNNINNINNDYNNKNEKEERNEYYPKRIYSSKNFYNTNLMNENLYQNKLFYQSPNNKEMNENKNNILINNNENNEIENNNNLRFNYPSNKDTLKKIREENNLNLKILQKKLTENFEEKETEKIIKYDLNPINYSRILKPKNLKQKYDYNNINNDYFSARNNIEYLNEKLKLNEQKRKMIMDKYINESNSNIIKRNKLSFQDYLLNNSKKNFHTEDIVNSERINDFFFKQNI